MRPQTKISLFGVRLATAVLVVYWLVIFAGTHTPTMPSLATNVWDKAIHFTAYFGLATLLCYVIPVRQSAWRKFGIVALIALAYGAFDELTQSFVKGRSTDIQDFLADALGVFSAIAIYATLRWAGLRWLNTREKKLQVPPEPSQATPSTPALRPLARSIDCPDLGKGM